MNKAEKFWDKLAKDIDPDSDQLEPEQVHMVKKISHYVQSTDNVLDYGCARGGIALELADKVEKVHGIDISSRMIAIAQKRQAAKEIANVRFDHSKITSIYLQPCSYNVILALNVIHLVEDPDLVLERIHELLAPDGLLIALTPCLGENRNIWSRMANPLFKVIVKLGLIPYVSFFKSARLKALFSKTGLIAIETKTIQESVATSLFVIARKSKGEHPS